MNPRLIALLLTAALPTLVGATPANMSVADYLLRKKQITTETRAAQSACGMNPSRDRELCLAKAVGVDSVAKADLEVAYRSTPRTRLEASEARAQARFWIARERCADTPQELRSDCLRDARSGLLAAQADAAIVMKAAENAAFAAEMCAASTANALQARSRACVVNTVHARPGRDETTK
jgi:hypothetical protein